VIPVVELVFPRQLSCRQYVQREVQPGKPSIASAISGIGFYLDQTLLSVPIPRKLFFSSISRTIFLVSKKQCNIWI
jgi:hypothetical protein